MNVSFVCSGKRACLHLMESLPRARKGVMTRKRRGPAKGPTKSKADPPAALLPTNANARCRKTMSGAATLVCGRLRTIAVYG